MSTHDAVFLAFGDMLIHGVGACRVMPDGSVERIPHEDIFDVKDEDGVFVIQNEGLNK